MKKKASMERVKTELVTVSGKDKSLGKVLTVIDAGMGEQQTRTEAVPLSRYASLVGKGGEEEKSTKMVKLLYLTSVRPSAILPKAKLQQVSQKQMGLCEHRVERTPEEKMQANKSN